MKIRGNALVMGDNVNTDVLHPSRFFSLDDRTVRAGFLQAAAGYEQIGGSDLSGRIIVAGENFGCGSSRETGARAFLLAGVKAVVARSVARIFGRNVRNLGLPAVECPALPALEPGAEVEVDLDAWKLRVAGPTALNPQLASVEPQRARGSGLRASALSRSISTGDPADFVGTPSDPGSAWSDRHKQTLGLELPLTPLDPYWVAVLAAGGLMPFLGLGLDTLPPPTIRRGPARNQP